MILSWLLVAASVLASSSAPASSPPAAAVRLESQLGKLHGLRVDFVQIRTVELSGEELQARGYLAFRPPHSFRLVYLDGDRQEVTVQEDTLWVWMPEENQAMRFPFDPHAPGNEVFTLFGGGDRSLSDVFQVSQSSWAGYSEALHLTPRSQEPGYPLEEIRLIVGTHGFPKKFFYREVTGDTVVFSFAKLESNPSNLDDLLRFEVPPGAEILDGTDLDHP